MCSVQRWRSRKGNVVFFALSLFVERDADQWPDKNVDANVGKTCFQSSCVQIENTSTPPMWFLFTLAIACVATKEHENCCSRRIDPKDHWSREVFRVWSLGNTINQDKNVTQGMKPTVLLNLSFLYRWFYICVIQVTDWACFNQ